MKNSTKASILLSITIIAFLLAICIGSVQLSLRDIYHVIQYKVFHIELPLGIKKNTVSILWNLRIPRAICAFLVGAALSISGASMQSVLQNPLASSYTLGVSSGASLGAALVITGMISFPFSSFLALPLMGFLFGLGTVFLAIYLTKKFDSGFQNQTVILVGMVLGLFVNALLTMVSAFAKDNIQQLISWQMGSFSSRGWSYVRILLPLIIIGSILILRYHKEMDMLTFGEETALSMGVNTKNIKLILFIYSALLTGVSVCFTGIIGFVDLIAPHVVRKIFGPKHNLLLPMSALFGGAFLMMTDMVARTILAPIEMPVGAITALIGAPFFGYIFFYKRKK